MIYKVFNIVFTSVVQKALPILMGIFVMNHYGTDAFSEFSLFLTSIASVVVFVSAGMVPALIKSISTSVTISERRKVFESYLFSAFYLWVGISVIFLIGESVNFLPTVFEKITYSFLIVSMCMIIILFSLSVAQTLARTVASLYISIINMVILIVGIGVSYYIEFGGFLYFYTFLFILMAVNCLVVMSRNQLCKFTKVKFISPFQLIVGTVKESGSIFIPNIIWMLAIFQFHIFVASDVEVNEYYPSFAIGYQWLTLIVFIPGALAPFVISSFANEKGGLKNAYFLSITYLGLGFFICVCFYIFNDYFSLLYGKGFSHKELDVIMFILMSGAIAGANAPLMQFLIGISKSIYTGIAAITWAVISILPRFDFGISFTFYEMFFYGYLCSYLSLVFIGYNKSR